MDDLSARVAELEAFLVRRGYRRCDVAACNCQSWHGGHAETRLHEIYEQLGEWAQGKTAVQAVDALRQRLADVESSLRLHLAVGPDDPLLIEPAERQIADLRARWKAAESENQELPTPKFLSSTIVSA